MPEAAQSNMQSRFRANPQPTYSQKMSKTRGDIRALIQDALRTITGDKLAKMRWPSYWKDIVEHYHVIVEGWPAEVPFANLSNVSNLSKLELLLQGWKDNQIRFRRVSEKELEELLAERVCAGMKDEESDDTELEEEGEEEGSSGSVAS